MTFDPNLNFSFFLDFFLATLLQQQILNITTFNNTKNIKKR